MSRARARHILVDTSEACQQLKDEIQGGADFADLARAHSSCPSGSRGGDLGGPVRTSGEDLGGPREDLGGDLGEFGRGEMVKDFDEVVFSAPVGEVQGPVKTDFGYHLLEVTHRDD